MNKILNGLEANVGEGVVNDGILGEWDTLSVNFAESTLVDQFFNGFQVGISPGDEGQGIGITTSVT